MKKITLMLGLSGLLFSFHFAQVLETEGEAFLLDGESFDMWGVRVASASQSEAYTRDLIANLGDYKASGINCISVYVQGSSGGFSDPFSEGGLSIDAAHWDRLVRIVEVVDVDQIVGRRLAAVQAGQCATHDRRAAAADVP